MNVYRKLVISTFNAKDLVLISQFYISFWQPCSCWKGKHQQG